MSDARLFELLPEIEDLKSGSKHRPYPAYAPSESEWLGNLPAHWTTRRLKYVATSRPSNVDKKSVDGEPPIRLCNYVDVYKNDYITPDIDFMQATADPSELAKFRLRQGDVLITKDSEEWSDIAVPAFVTQDFEDVACGYHLSQVRPRPGVMDGEYLFRAFRAGGVSEQFQVAANGVTRFGISAGAIGDVMFPLPPLDEQRSIAAFLRNETARIDRLIAEKTRLIELLAEKRAAVITHAVTKGLDASIPMKPSGIDWLGNVPVDWQVKRIKFIARIGNGSTPSRENPDYWSGDYPWLNSGVVNQREVTEASDFVSALALAECHLPIVSPPAVLVGITGEGKTRGMATVLRIEATINQHLAFVKPTKALCVVDYLRAVLQAAYQFLRDESGGAGSTKGAITCDQLGNVSVPVPPLAEQQAIIAHLDGLCTKLDTLTALITAAIDRLREYRSALITAAVTGRIDVREVGRKP